MDNLKRLDSAINSFILDPNHHDILTLVKGVRNGIVYGSKVRFPHALVMIFLFRSGTFRQKAILVLKATKQHARNLGLFSLIYKLTLLFLRRTSPDDKPRSLDPFVAGLLGGYLVFGRSRSSVSQQIVIYVFARACLAAAKLAFKPKEFGGVGLGGGGTGEIRRLVERNGWPVFASLSWACIMWLFKWHPDVVQPSMRSSMTYIYNDSDSWDSLRTLIWHNK